MIKQLAFLAFMIVACQAASYQYQSSPAYSAPAPAIPQSVEPAPAYAAPAPVVPQSVQPAPAYSAPPPAPAYAAPPPAVPQSVQPAPAYSAPPPAVPQSVQPAPAYSAPPPAPAYAAPVVPQSVQPAPAYAAPAQQAYNSIVNLQSTMLWSTEAPEFESLCQSKRASSSSNTFHLAHPTNHSLFIQCDEFGKAFIKVCPFNTIFTENMACEVSEQVLKSSLMSPAVGAYGNVAEPMLAVELVRPAPEFNDLCVSKHVALGLAVFYMPHPTENKKYVQCDEFGKAFLKSCPMSTIFTENMACEKVDHLLPNLKSMAITPTTAYGQQVGLTAEMSTEAPQFENLCMSNKQMGVAIFYVAHPSDNTKYIQCDEFGKAFLKTCTFGTIFTENMACEKVYDHMMSLMRIPKLSIDVGEELPQFEQQCSSQAPQGAVVFYMPYPDHKDWFIQCDMLGRAFLKKCPSGTVFGADMECVFEGFVYPTDPVPVAPAYGGLAAKPVVTPSEWSKESPEFSETCSSKRVSGTLVFYLPHPTHQDWFIQCDENNRAFVKTCISGTIFTENLTCEKIGELHAIWKSIAAPVLSQASPSYASNTVVEAPAKMETVMSSYASQPDLKTTRIEKIKSFNLQSSKY